jgi:hypothetical protein
MSDSYFQKAEDRSTEFLRYHSGPSSSQERISTRLTQLNEASSSINKKKSRNLTSLQTLNQKSSLIPKLSTFSSPQIESKYRKSVLKKTKDFSIKFSQKSLEKPETRDIKSDPKNLKPFRSKILPHQNESIPKNSLISKHSFNSYPENFLQKRISPSSLIPRKPLERIESEILYHMTNKIAGEKINLSKKMIPGMKGKFGPAIYFGENPFSCVSKSVFGASDLVFAKVRLRNILNLKKCEPSLTKQMLENKGNFAVRGDFKDPEYAVYDSEDVEVLRVANLKNIIETNGGFDDLEKYHNYLVESFYEEQPEKVEKRKEGLKRLFQSNIVHIRISTIYQNVKQMRALLSGSVIYSIEKYREKKAKQENEKNAFGLNSDDIDFNQDFYFADSVIGHNIFSVNYLIPEFMKEKILSILTKIRIEFYVEIDYKDYKVIIKYTYEYCEKMGFDKIDIILIFEEFLFLLVIHKDQIIQEWIFLDHNYQDIYDKGVINSAPDYSMAKKNEIEDQRAKYF